ncbi:carboxymuconolactone decarboxylase family protein [Legionella sp. km772]|uniref:carboxymuconolactone decarboxylase family protein n=1 Tax=Legionella sp. km772 TaxID=2498111 RepID=UPI000F8CF64D|nr:carboxymuconolactone decarboxylase family protein [Legionella sp. km772]RUR07121.1 alkyl hydroperoxide reductase [Legionella sp. km772]
MLEGIKSTIPDVAKDIRLNLTKVLDLTQTEGLTAQQILGAALAVAFSLDDKQMISELNQEITEEVLIDAAKLAASLMAMTNIYYRFIHLAEDSEVEHLPAGLRMQGMMNPGVDRATFEALSLAVSALNGCGLCISSHTRQLREHGFSASAIARLGKIAAVLHAAHLSKKLA